MYRQIMYTLPSKEATVQVNKVSQKDLILKILSFSSPIVLANIINMISIFYAIYLLSRLDKIQMAASALGLNTYLAISMTIISAATGISILIGGLNQETDKQKVNAIINNAAFVFMLLAVVLFVIVWHLDIALTLLNQPAELIPIVKTFFHYAALILIPITINTILFQSLIGLGKATVCFVLSVMRMLITVALCHLFIFGSFNTHPYGLAGVALAILTSNILIILPGFGYCLLNSNLSTLFKPAISKLSLQYCKSIILLGLPIGLQVSGEYLALNFATYLFGLLGITALSAIQATYPFRAMLSIIIFGLSQGLSVNLAGANKSHAYSLIKRIMTASRHLLLLILLPIACIMILFAKKITLLIWGDASGFNDQVIMLSARLLQITAIIMLFDGIRTLYGAGLRGLEDATTPMRIGFTALWLIALPLAYIFGITWPKGPEWLSIGFGIGILIGAFIIYKKYKLRENDIIRTQLKDQLQ